MPIPKNRLAMYGAVVCLLPTMVDLQHAAVRWGMLGSGLIASLLYVPSLRRFGPVAGRALVVGAAAWGGLEFAKADSKSEQPHVVVSGILVALSVILTASAIPNRLATPPGPMGIVGCSSVAAAPAAIDSGMADTRPAAGADSSATDDHRRGAQ